MLVGAAVNASSMSDGGTRADGSRLQKRQRAAYLKLIAAIQLRRGNSDRISSSAASCSPNELDSITSHSEHAAENDDEL